MSTDWYTKLVLTVLAGCAVFLVAQELRDGGKGASADGRFRLQVVPMGRMMLKIDAETGKTWRANFPDPKVWTPIADEPVDTLDDVPDEPPEDDLGEEEEEEDEGQLDAPPPPAP